MRDDVLSKGEAYQFLVGYSSSGARSPGVVSWVGSRITGANLSTYGAGGNREADEPCDATQVDDSFLFVSGYREGAGCHCHPGGHVSSQRSLLAWENHAGGVQANSSSHVEGRRPVAPFASAGIWRSCLFVKGIRKVTSTWSWTLREQWRPWYEEWVNQGLEVLGGVSQVGSPV